jgi:CRISPR-associated protein Cas1
MPKRNPSIATPTAHLFGPGKLKVIGGRLAFSNGKGSPARLDPERLENVLCYGNVGITQDAFTMLFRHGVQVSWMSPRGARFRGRLTGLDDSATLLRMLQHRAMADPATKLQLARDVVCDKIRSQVDAARHYQRHGCAGAKQFVRRAKAHLTGAAQARDLDILRGVEGISSKNWFEVFGKLLDPPWSFPGRVRRPPTDPVNALLSLGYTWLTNRMIARVQAMGLELNLGALHEYRPGRPSLACDLVEPLRVGVVDRWVVKVLNRAFVKRDDFEELDGKGVRLVRDAFSRVLGLWEQDWQAGRGGLSVQKQVDKFAGVLRRLGKRFRPDEIAD